ncbi:LacI family DNA-binding transcriptional regulator [Lactobacillus sp. PV037]|uniref:substrate-binding domain-containing protein n=1 Tax=unclassified Lactobacillus TaxID=2620435 RepID=UPI0022401FDC|nr:MULTISPECIES: substrate-binding domain-containing protein [unclassified Lactobacillus]QNQ81924.1 LacI family DNA-binding transcriptional regulator [Lactobacillus sp. PV012]QNQ84040.1 LacI family DNA-binding transcriptional regulator [Lactobacillus sp. PV037]
MDKQDITIYDVAREAKVSMATVSRVVNGNNNVRKETRERVLEVIKRLNYQPNAVAQGLASKKTTTVGLVVPELTNLHFAELSKGIDDIATMYKYNIILTSVENKMVSDENVIQNLLNKQVDGVIYMADEMSPQAREAFLRTNTPIVLAGTVSLNGEFDRVSIDYNEAEKDAFELLYKDGKTRLGLVISNPEVAINKKRIASYREVLEEKDWDKEYIYSGLTSYEDGYNLASKLLADEINGVVVTSDLVAAGIIHGVMDRGIKVPEDFEVISAVSTNISKVLRPTLTAVQQPLYDIGAVAMRMLTKLMNKEELDEKHVTLPYKIDKKNSTLNK